MKKRQLGDRGFHRNSSFQVAWDTSIARTTGIMWHHQGCSSLVRGTKSDSCCGTQWVDIIWGCECVCDLISFVGRTLIILVWGAKSEYALLGEPGKLLYRTRRSQVSTAVQWNPTKINYLAHLIRNRLKRKLGWDFQRIRISRGRASAAKYQRLSTPQERSPDAFGPPCCLPLVVATAVTSFSLSADIYFQC